MMSKRKKEELIRLLAETCGKGSSLVMKGEMVPYQARRPAIGRSLSKDQVRELEELVSVSDESTISVQEFQNMTARWRTR